MALIKNCKKCNALISIRKMPNGNWLPFDFQTDELHDCKKAKERIISKKSKNYEPGTKLYRIDEAIQTGSCIEFYYDSKTEGPNKYSIMKPTEIIEPVKSTDKQRVLGTAMLEDCDYDFRIDKIKFVNICKENQVADVKKWYGYDIGTVEIETIERANSHEQNISLDVSKSAISKVQEKGIQENTYRPGSKLDTIARAIEMNQFVEFYYDSGDKGKNYHSIMKPIKIISPKKRYNKHRIIGSGILEKRKYDFEIISMKYIKACDAEYVNNILAIRRKEKEELEKIVGIDFSEINQMGFIEKDSDVNNSPKSEDPNKKTQPTMHDKTNEKGVNYLPIIFIAIILLWLLYLTLI